MGITTDSSSRVSWSDKCGEQDIALESPSCCLGVNFILKDYYSLALVGPAQISVSGNPGSGVHGLPGMLRRRMSFMQKGALIPAAFNAPA